MIILLKDKTFAKKKEIYDKVSWHIDGGENIKTVLDHFKFVLDWAKKKNLLSNYGLEIYKLGIDDSCSITEEMLTPKGNAFFKNNYDKFIDFQKKDESKLNYMFNNYDYTKR